MDNGTFAKKRHKSRIIWTQLILISVVSFIFALLSNSCINYDKLLYLYSFLGTLSVFGSIYLYYIVVRNWFDPYIMIYMSFIVFHFGQNILLALSVKNYDYVFYKGFTTPSINLRGTVFTVICLLIFNLGALVAVQIGRNKGRKENREVKPNNSRKSDLSYSALRLLGLAIFTITVIPAFYVVVRSAIISMNYGYIGLYLLQRPMFIISFLDYLFVPGTIMLLASYKHKGLANILLKYVILSYAVLSLVGGGRGQGLAIFMVLITYDCIQNNSPNLRARIRVGVMILFVVIMVPIIANFRGIEGKTLANFVDTVIYTAESNALIDTVGEMGGSMAPLLMTMNVIPTNVGFKYGESYFAAIMSAMPANLDPSGLINYFSSKATLDNWLKDYYKMSYGPGFSMIAEAYYNFGYYGLAIMFFWGVIISKLLSIEDYDSIMNNSFRLYSKLVLLYALFTFPRRPTIYFVKQLVYLIIVVVIVLELLKGKKEEKVKHLSHI